MSKSGKDIEALLSKVKPQGKEGPTLNEGLRVAASEMMAAVKGEDASAFERAFRNAVTIAKHED